MSDLDHPSQRVVAVLGRGVVRPDEPILRADDLGAVRGDGVFETMHVRDGHAWLLDEHLARMARSAARLGITLPARQDLIGLIDQALGAWTSSAEAALRVVCTRGIEGAAGPATVFAMVSPITASQIGGRRDGVTLVTASLGIPADARQTTPWLLAGAKTLSYAVNMALLRWATENGADDVLWTSSDGYVLEAPTSTVVWLDGGTLWTVPVEETGILAGTTARYLVDHARELGWASGERMITPAGLAASDGAWLTSSVRGAAEIREINGAPLPAAKDTARLLALLGFDV